MGEKSIILQFIEELVEKNTLRYHVKLVSAPSPF